MNHISPTARPSCVLFVVFSLGEECDSCGGRRPFCEMREHTRLIHPDQSGYVCRDERACAVRQHVAYHLRPAVVIDGVVVEISRPVRTCDMCTAGTGIVTADYLAWDSYIPNILAAGVPVA